jgi:hypothetical protein
MKKVWVVFLMIIVMMGISCKTGEESNDNVQLIFGTWQYEFTYQNMQGRETAVLNSDYTFEILFEAFINGAWVFLPGTESVRGTFATAGNTVTITVTGREYYNTIWQQIVNPPEVYNGTFSISNDGNTLNMQRDMNSDGDFNDEFENVIYTRVL